MATLLIMAALQEESRDPLGPNNDCTSFAQHRPCQKIISAEKGPT
jgi:hypothetical protein